MATFRLRATSPLLTSIGLLKLGQKETDKDGGRVIQRAWVEDGGNDGCFAFVGLFLNVQPAQSEIGSMKGPVETGYFHFTALGRS